MSSLKYILKIANDKRKKEKTVPFDDLVHSSIEGLIKATKTFNPKRNMRFINYANWFMITEIDSYIAKSKIVYINPHRIRKEIKNPTSEINNLYYSLDNKFLKLYINSDFTTQKFFSTMTSLSLLVFRIHQLLHEWLLAFPWIPELLLQVPDEPAQLPFSIHYHHEVILISIKKNSLKELK